MEFKYLKILLMPHQLLEVKNAQGYIKDAFI